MENAQQGETPEKKEDYSLTRRRIDISDLQKVLKKGANHGLCGGHNLGNTCFMNSSIACLSNCTELTTYFLTGKFKDDVNTKNKEGVGGKLAYAWNDLLKEYWNSKTGTGNPSQVKSAVAKKVRKFAGYSQQDSNEFMTEFLSLLSEDLNKTTKKKYRELKEKGKNESEFECAKRFWDLHVELNDSIITDLFSGLFKSEVHCSKCNFDNITFDPFNTLTLPIPSFNDVYTSWNDLFYIPKYSLRKSCRFTAINIRKSLPLKKVMEELSKIEGFKYKFQKLKYIQVSDGKLLKFVKETESKTRGEYIFVFDDLSKE
jgi:ubiquitin carboxyl-terminal hydrolase 4/11/15